MKTYRRSAETILSISGLIGVAVAIVVMYGWLSSNESIIQILPYLAPMQFNTALGFFMLGTALVFKSLHFLKITRAIAFLISLFALITFAQYLLEINLGIDEFFIKDFIDVRTSHPGRMSPITAICFLLFGITILAPKNLILVKIGLASTVFAFSVIAIAAQALSYTTDTYILGSIVRMALHTASCFCILSCGFLYFSVDVFRQRHMDFWDIVPFTISSVIIAITLFYANTAKEMSTIQNQTYFQSLIEKTEDAIIDRFSLYENSLHGAQGLMYASNYFTLNEWKIYVDALNIEQNLPGINGIGYIDFVKAEEIDDYVAEQKLLDRPNFKNHPQTNFKDKFIIKYIEPVSINAAAVGLDVGFEKNRRSAAEEAILAGEPRLTGVIQLVQDNQKQPGFLFYIPIYTSRNTPSSIYERMEKIRGWVYAPFIGYNFFNGIEDMMLNQLELSVYDNEVSESNIIYTTANKDSHSLYSAKTTIELGGKKWIIEWRGSEAMQLPASNRIAYIILALGALLAAISFYIINRLVKNKGDIEQRIKETTDELSEVQERFEFLMQNSAIGMGLVTIDGRWIEFNNKMCEMIGYTREELKLRTLQSLTYDDDLGLDSSDLKKILSGEIDSYSVEKRYKHKNGHTIWVLLGIALIRKPDGSPSYYFSQAIDITDLKGALKDLKNERQFSELVINNIPDWVFVKDEDFKIVKANESFLELYPEDERDSVVGRTTIEKFSKEEADIFLEQDKVAFEKGISRAYEDIKSHDGSAKKIYTTKVRFTDINGKKYILGIARDITELQNAKTVLEEKVKERTIELQVANETKDLFLANMSHELRTPLNSIIGLTKIMMDEDDFTVDQIETLRIVDKSALSLLEIVNDILDIAKIESGKIILEQKPFSPCSLMYSIVDQIKPLASSKALTLITNEKELPSLYVIGDEFRLSRVLLNLASNAIKYTDEGSVKIEVKFKEVSSNKVEMHFKITDTGIGIPENMIDRIFDKFTQAEESTERKFGGTGLGLNITKQLIEIMGGEIRAESELGKGSTFLFKIPFFIADGQESFQALKDASDRESAKISHTRKSIKDARILIAEDHEFNQVFLLKLLKRIGATNFDLATDGNHALKKYNEKGSYDAILMDCHMPDKSGYEVTDIIRAAERDTESDERAVIIAITADAMVGTKQLCLDRGMDDYLSKPIDEQEFRKVLSRWFIIENEISNNKYNKAKGNTYTPVDLTILKEYVGDDEEIIRDLLAIYYKKSCEDIEILSKNMAKTKSNNWLAGAHGLKGSSGYIGADRLKDLCEHAQNNSSASAKDKKAMLKSIKEEHAVITDYLRDQNLLDT